MNLFKRAIKFIFRKYAFYLCNHKYAGSFTKKAFLIKAKWLKKAGFNVDSSARIVGPIFITGDFSVGKETFINRNFQSIGNGFVKIGSNCDIAPDVFITTGGHLIGDSERRAGEGIINNVIIGNGVWIGARTTILNNITIGDSSVVAAGSVVIRNVGSNVLVAGNPAILKKELK